MSLADLVIDEKELDKALLERILKPHVRIGKHSGEIRLTPIATKLSIKQKIILFLLAKKAAVALTIKGVQEVATPREMEMELGIGGSSLRPILKRLYDSGIVSGDKGHYWIGNHILSEIAERFFKAIKEVNQKNG